MRISFWSAFLGLFLAFSAVAQVRITEFMASNSHTLADEDGDYPDWIEIQNTSGAPVNLQNWSLTDKAGTPFKWLFPATNIAANSFLVVFASAKDRRVAGSPLHTNFKLSADGDYLALIRSDGAVMTEFSPQYLPQFPDVSFGTGMQAVWTTLAPSNAPVHYKIPVNSSDDGVWAQLNFADNTWSNGVNGVGYDTGAPDPLETSFAANVLNTGPNAFWRLNETSGAIAANLGSTGNNGQGGYFGNIILGQPGPRPPQFTEFETNNLAPFFNGTNAYVNGPFQLLSQLTEFSAAGWINPTGTQQKRTGIFGENNVVEFGFNPPGTLHVFTTKGSLDYIYPFPNNEWHHVAVVGGTNFVSLFVDGIRVTNKTVSGATFNESAFYFNIGGGGIFDATTNWFLGFIDEVAVWKRALSTNEIAGLTSTNNSQLNYTPYIATDVRSPMYNSNATAYIRIPFNVTDPLAFSNLRLLMRYDDGFVAYLNGQEILRSNAPSTLAWNASATTRHANAAALNWETFDITAARPLLQPGANILAIQALNLSSNSVHFFMQAQLLGENKAFTETGPRYFKLPTPGSPNGASPADLGPIFSGAGHSPATPRTDESLVVTGLVAQAFNSISNVTLTYRVMFGPEISVPMNDAGTNGDAFPGNGVWTGTIPAGVAAPGQMIRYYLTATDLAGNTSRWPIFPDPTNSAQYLGTVVIDSSIQTLLPMVHLFVQNTNAADTQIGTPASLFYLNEFYDNVNMNIHGQSSASWAKKSHNFNFNGDHDFLSQPGAIRDGHIIFLTDYSDKARMRTTLTYAMAAQVGGVGFFSFPIRIHLNGSFWGIEDMVEDGDENFLSRIGRDPNGALYKMYNSLNSVASNEKKTRQWEDSSDLNLLVTNLNESIPLATRVAYGYDHLDLPQAAEYFATMALASSQDLGHKNYYLYHDNDGTGEWAIFPWDVDLTWGRDWVSSFTSSNYFNDVMFTTNVLNFYPGASVQNKATNRLFDLFFASSDFRQMYLRRLRTFMDTVLMPPGTATNLLVIEPIIRQYESKLNPPAISPSDAALDNAAWGPVWGDTSLSVFPNDAERIISGYLAGRRTFLYTSPGATLNGDPIPAAQPANAALSIASWDFNPSSGNPNEQYVELANTNSYAVDISGWKIVGGISYTFRGGTVVPAGKSVFISPNVNAFRGRLLSPHGGQSLLVQGPFSGFLSSQGNTPLILENSSNTRVTANSYAGNLLSSQLTQGNLVVLRVGDGAETPSSHGNSVFLDQFTTNGVLVSTITIPNNNTNSLIVSGSATSEGALTRSPDGRLLTFAGYRIALSNAIPLATSLANTNSIVAPRALGVVDLTGAFTVAALTTNQYSLNNLRAGATDGHGNYWGAGGNSGTFYFGAGPTNTVQTNVANTIDVQAINGDLYFSTQKITNGIWKISGTPATPSVATPVFKTGGSSSSYAFAFNPNFATAYVADDTLTTKGGVQRWDFNGSTWTMSYAFSGITNVGARGLTVDFNGPSPVIYATTAESTTNRLVRIIDTGAASTVTTLTTAGVNQLFRGVAFAPDAAGVVPQWIGAGAATNGFKLTWTALLYQNYSAQYVGDPAVTNWTTFTNITATAPVMTVYDTSAPAGTNRYYRVVLNP